MFIRLGQAGIRLIVRLARRRTGSGISRLRLVLPLILFWSAVALPQPTIHVAPSDHARHEEVRRTLTRELGGMARIQPWSGEAGPEELVITLDRATLSEIRANSPEQPVLALFTPSHAVEEVVEDRRRFSAIYSDPPLVRQARLGQLIIPRAGTLAILASPEDASRYRDLRDELEAIGLESRVFVVPSQDELIRHLARALSYGDYLLGTPDSAIFNRQTVKPLLLTSYRSNRLVIGPSRAFVRAGAVASTYTSARDQIGAAVPLIRHWLAHDELEAARFPAEFDVAVNQQVARSMDLLVPSEKELRETLREQEDES